MADNERRPEGADISQNARENRRPEGAEGRSRPRRDGAPHRRRDPRGGRPTREQRPKREKKDIIADIKARMEGHKKASVIILAVVLVAVLSLLIWGISSIVMSFVNVGGIVVKGDCPYSDEELISAAEFDMDGKLRDIDERGAEEKILSRLPYIYEVKVGKSFPNRIKITVKCREAAFYTELSGRYFALSSDMIVLEEQKKEAAFRERSLTELVLPKIHSAILSEKVTFGKEDVDYGYIHDLIGELSESQFGGGVTLLDFSDKFDISFVYRGKYIIVLGSSVDLELKLKACHEVLTDGMFAREIYALINATTPKYVSVTELSEAEFLEKTE